MIAHKRGKNWVSLKKKAQSRLLVEVQYIIMSPFTLEQARNQIPTLNWSAGYKRIVGWGSK